MSTLLGKISGQLLETNLLRDGVDLTFKNTNASEPVLYFDVNSRRVSLNKDFANSVLDVNNQIRTTNLITDTFQLPTLVINQENITTYSNTLNITSNESVILSATKTGNILIDGNRIIATETNENLVLDPSGTGIVSVAGDARAQADISITGDITVDGSIIFGNDIVDTVDFNSHFTGDLIPTVTETYDLGSETLAWFSVNISDTLFVSQSIENFSSDIIINLNNNYNVIINDFTIDDSDISNLLGNITIQTTGDVLVTNNSALVVPVGTTQQRELGPQIIIDGGSGASILSQTLDTLDATNDVDYTDTVYHGGKAENDPVMNTADLRFNTTYELFEGYSDLGVVSFGSVYSDDKITKIITEPSGNAITCLINDNPIVIFDTVGMDVERIKSSDIVAYSSNITGSSDLLFRTQGSGSVAFENIKIKSSNIQNTSTGSLVFEKTNNGYYKINTTSGVVIPQGNTSSRPTGAQIGDTRYNTETTLVETFDGTAYVDSWGAENAVSQQDFQDIMNEYSLIFG